MEKLEKLEKVFLPSYFPFLGSPGHDQPGLAGSGAHPPIIGLTKKTEHYLKTIEKLEKLEKVYLPSYLSLGEGAQGKTLPPATGKPFRPLGRVPIT